MRADDDSARRTLLAVVVATALAKLCPVRVHDILYRCQKAMFISFKQTEREMHTLDSRRFSFVAFTQ